MTSPASSVTCSVRVRRPPSAAFAAFTDGIGSWWPLVEYSVHGENATTAGFVEGAIVETSRDGETVSWGEVTAWDPPNRLAFTWHPEPDPHVATRVSVTFTPEEEGTRVDLVHDGWERYGTAAAEIRAQYEHGWPIVLSRYVRYVEAT